MARTLCTLPALLMLLLIPGCEGEYCSRKDVDTSGVWSWSHWSWSHWSFDVTGCTSLDLQSDSIGADGARALAEALKTNGALTTLDLRSNSIGDDGARALAEALKTNGALTTLYLHSNSIGADGARALAEALKTNGALTTLDLHSNSIGADGARALAEALKTNGALTTLDLRSNSIGDDGVRALAEALKSTVPEVRHRKLDMVLSALAAADAEHERQRVVQKAKADAEHERQRVVQKAKADAEHELQRVVQKAKLLGLYAVFQEQGIANDALARAVQWCTDMGAAAAEDLSYLRRDEIAQLVESLGLPIIKQRKLVEKLAAAVRLAKDEV